MEKSIRDEYGRFKKGYHPPTEFKKGNMPWDTGKHHSEETKRKMSKAKIGKHFGIEFKRGQHFSPKTEFKKGQFIGFKNPHWKGGVYRGYSKTIRESQEYKDWRSVVFERDLYTCRECDKSGVYIEAHHIKRWIDYPELRFDINNGLTLCKLCHHKRGRHSWKDNSEGSYGD